MTTILFTLVIAFFASLAMVPLVRRLGIYWGVMDLPNERNVHLVPVPRIGGLAMFVAFWVGLGVTRYLGTALSDQLLVDEMAVLVILGNVVVFGLGLWDDFKRLSPRIKVVVQIIGATLAFAGGLQIEIGGWPSVSMAPILSFVLTVFWFLLIINALNLIDGLDGLAAGIALFATILMVILSILGQRYLQAVLLSALAGVTLGLLVYNFPPASIFMGDGGSYFIGYWIAAIALLGSSSKTQVGATLLIALASLGVPVFDTILAPARRFLRGMHIFQPDRRHVHHRLLNLMNNNVRKSVLVLYGFSILMCGISILMVYFSDKQASLFLVLIGTLCFLFFRLGYFNYFNRKDFVWWLRDVADELGISVERRKFLDIQVLITRSTTYEELWLHACSALNWMSFDFGEIRIFSNHRKHLIDGCHGEGISDTKLCSNLPKGSAEPSQTFQWQRNGYDPQNRVCDACQMKMELPLMDDITGRNLGTLWLVKDLKTEMLAHYTLKRIEHLRRTVEHAIRTIQNKTDANL